MTRLATPLLEAGYPIFLFDVRLSPSWRSARRSHPAPSIHQEHRDLEGGRHRDQDFEHHLDLNYGVSTKSGEPQWSKTPGSGRAAGNSLSQQKSNEARRERPSSVVSSQSRPGGHHAG